MSSVADGARELLLAVCLARLRGLPATTINHVFISSAFARIDPRLPLDSPPPSGDSRGSARHLIVQAHAIDQLSLYSFRASGQNDYI